MRELEILAISDTHLGESTSLLAHPEGLAHLESVLCGKFSDGQNQKFGVKEMVLMGDIPDRTLAATDEIQRDTREFIKMLGRVAEIENLVYIPGNHDHTVWTEYSKQNDGTSITEPKEHRIVHNGDTVVPNGIDGRRMEALLSIFFGDPPAPPWGPNLSFIVANPVYVQDQVSNGRTYVFAHGTHFKNVVVPGWRNKSVVALARLYSIPVEPLGDMSDLDLEKLERACQPFADSLWKSAEGDPTPRTDLVWSLLNMFLVTLKYSPINVSFGNFDNRREAEKKLNKGVVPQELVDAFEDKGIQMPHEGVLLFSIGISDLPHDLDSKRVPAELRQGFADSNTSLSNSVTVKVEEEGDRWLITDRQTEQIYLVKKSKTGLELRIYKRAIVYVHRNRDDRWYIAHGTAIHYVERKEWQGRWLIIYPGKNRWPAGDKLFSLKGLDDDDGQTIRKLAEDDTSIENWKKYFRGPMLAHIGEEDPPTGEVTFVYGDTHDGGWGEIEGIRVYNTGGWTVHSPRKHPACHLFAVEDGQESLLDVSYEGVETANGRPLLAKTIQDTEHEGVFSYKVFRGLSSLGFSMPQCLDDDPNLEIAGTA